MGTTGYDPAIIAAFIDGTLDEITAKRIARAALWDSALASEIRKHRRPVAGDNQAGNEPANTLEASGCAAPAQTEDREAPTSGNRRGRRWMSICLLLTVSALSFWLGKSQWFAPPALVLKREHLIAAGGLAEALDNASTSAEPDKDGFRVDMTFLNAEGRHCRGFEIDSLSGIACRADGRWAIKWALAADRTQLSLSPSAALAAAEADLRVTRAFTPAQEDAARREGWAE